MSPPGHDVHCARRLRAALASAEPLFRATAPERAEQATLHYLMSDYVDHLEHHVRQILDRR